MVKNAKETKDTWSDEESDFNSSTNTSNYSPTNSSVGSCIVSKCLSGFVFNLFYFYFRVEREHQLQFRKQEEGKHRVTTARIYSIQTLTENN